MGTGAPRWSVRGIATAGTVVAIWWISGALAGARQSADIVLHASDATDVGGSWQLVSDASAAGGLRVHQPNAGAAKIVTPLAAPRHYFDLPFRADAGISYRLWIRAKADGNHYSNDSVHVQFSGSVDGSGHPVFRLGTVSATTVVLEDCPGCPMSGWGWQDNEYGGSALGDEIRFAQSGPQTLRIQAREDGISIDQIVLSPSTYFARAPGPPRGDDTRLAKTVFDPPPGANRPPAVDGFASMSGVWPYEMQFQDQPDPNTFLGATATDADGDPLSFEWRDGAGTVIGTSESWQPPYPDGLPPGTHSFTVTVRDGRGGEASDSVTVTVRPFEEIVIGMGYKESVAGPPWERAELADGAIVVRDPDRGAPKVNTPAASPASYVDVWFPADPTLEYKLWVRLRADRDYWGNDSLWLQFGGATDAAGNPVFRTGTSSGLAVNLEECSSCGISGWGWRDDSWGVPGAMSSRYLRFPAGGLQSLRLQTREDGVMVDRIVLSARQYKSARPGAVKDDRTFLHITALWGS